MATLFEQFINDNMPSTLRADIPESGSLTAGIPLVPTGVGLKLAPFKDLGFKASNTIFVSTTNPLADFNNLNEALVYAKSIAQAISVSNAPVRILLDAGSFTLNDVDLTSVGIDDSVITIEGISPSEPFYGWVTSFNLSPTEVVLDAYVANGYAVKCRYLYLLFKNCNIKCYPPVTTDANGVGLSFYSGGAWFIDCKILFTPAPTTSGTGKNVFLNVYRTSGVFVNFIRTYINTVLVRGTANYTYSFIDLTGASHPYLFSLDSYIYMNTVPLFSSCNFIFFNAANTDTSATPYSQVKNTVIRISPFATYAKTITFWKSVAIGQTSNPNIFERNTFISSLASATGKILWFDYDTIPGTGKLYLNYNIFINQAALNSINIANIGAGDILYLSKNSYQGLMTKMIGTGTVSLSADEELLEGKVSLNESITDGSYSGICFRATVDTGVVFGDALYLDTADNTYKKADATTSATCPVKVISIDGEGSGKRVMRTGFIRSSGKFSFAAGNTLFVATTAGAITETEPVASGNISQRLGWATATDTIYFEPDQTYIEAA